MHRYTLRKGKEREDRKRLLYLSLPTLPDKEWQNWTLLRRRQVPTSPKCGVYNRMVKTFNIFKSPTTSPEILNRKYRKATPPS